MKEYTVKLTEKDVGLLMYAIEGYDAHAQVQARQGKRDKTKTERLHNELVELDSKLYQMILKIHSGK